MIWQPRRFVTGKLIGVIHIFFIDHNRSFGNWCLLDSSSLAASTHHSVPWPHRQFQACSSIHVFSFSSLCSTNSYWTLWQNEAIQLDFVKARESYICDFALRIWFSFLWSGDKWRKKIGMREWKRERLNKRKESDIHRVNESFHRINDHLAESRGYRNTSFCV